MDSVLAKKLLLSAAENPQIVDDLILYTEAMINPYAPRAFERLLACMRRVGQGLTDDEAKELSENENRYANFLQHPRALPPDLAREMEQRFPPANAAPNWSAPPGYVRKGGVAGWLYKKGNSFLHAYSKKGTRFPTIDVTLPCQQTITFPWVHVFPINQFLRHHGFRRLSSRYVSVAGATAYEVCYKPSDHPAYFGQSGPTPEYTDSKANNLEHAMVLLVTQNNKGYQITLSTTSLDADKAGFDAFLAQL